jgi:hypothetical protein
VTEETGKGGVHYRFYEFKLFAFVHFLQTEDVLKARLAKVTLLHLQNGIRLVRRRFDARREVTYIKRKGERETPTETK